MKPAAAQPRKLPDVVFFQEGPGLRNWQWTDDGMKVINGTNILPDGSIDISNTDKFIAQAEFETRYRHFAIDEGDIVLSSSGTLGKVGRIAADHLPLMMNTSVIRFRTKNPSIVDDGYLFAFLRSPQFQSLIRAFAVGGVQQNFGPVHLKQIEMPVPPLHRQQRIADILSAYDDLLENNRRRMALLEDAARQLYREWFVRLRFPGHEHTRVTNGVPEGWERQTLAELCEFIDYGYTASAEVDEVGPKFLRITDIVPDAIDWASVPYCPIEEDRLAKFRLLKGDIVIARTGATVGYAKRLHKRHPETVFASYLVRLRLTPKLDNLLAGIYVESGDYKSYVQSRVGGAAQPNANAKVLSAAEILVPPPNIQRVFHGTVEPLIDQRELLELQNQQLRAARDLLLPRLISGEITV
jgi:type I restriction enzyme, S subunit